MFSVHLLLTFLCTLFKIPNMSWWLYTIPFISALIHWVTIWMALKLLFHPRKPMKIGWFTLQGVFPKRQRQIAESLGSIVSRELLSFEDIRTSISNPENLQKILPLADAHIDDFLRNKLKKAMPVISMFIGDKTIRELKDVFMKELELLFPVIMNNYADHLKADLDLEKIIVEKVSNFSSDKLEEILQQILTKEFRFVEVIGAALGFLIGLMQIFLTLFLK